MIDEVYKKSFKEVYEIIENIEDELKEKIPSKFMEFIEEKMDLNYETHIKKDIEIDKQDLLQETQDILALIYRSYLATESEKLEFAEKDKKELINIEKIKANLKQYEAKDLEEVFKRRRNLNNIIVTNELVVIEKVGIIKKILNKLKSFFN